MTIPRAALLFAIALPCTSAFAVEPRVEREAIGPVTGEPGCSLEESLDGEIANYHWHELCSGYIWVYSAWQAGEAVGVRYGGPANPAVNPENVVKRVITYYRDVVPRYSQTVDVYLHDDPDQNGCPGAVLAQDLDLDPALRWNCSDFNAPIVSEGVVVRQVHDGGVAPSFATDGPFIESCDPGPTFRSYYYGPDGSSCTGWVGPSGRFDNILGYIVIDSPKTVVERTSWGHVKGLFR